jgi:diguanylate cyclase (GGDEF)-like protein
VLVGGPRTAPGPAAAEVVDAACTTGTPVPSPSLSSDVDPVERLWSGADGERDLRARAHEAAAEVLAARGDWQRAYAHLKAATRLARLPGTIPELPTEQLHHEVDRLRRERAEARELSRRDALTSGYNRRYLDERLTTLRGNERGAGCLALADVDHFKQINDVYGHGHGDDVLRRLAALMSADLPRGAFCARYGGEEFALVMPDLDGDAAVAVCEAARERVDRHSWDDVVPGLRVTVSLGVARLDDVDGAPGATLDGAASSPLDAADALLYVAKRAGRNAVAYRADGEVRLAGAAAHRRGLAVAARSAFPRD